MAASGREDAAAAAAIHRQRKIFQRLVHYGWLELERGRGETAAGYAQIAADYAWFNHPGLFASAGLEQLLARLALLLESPPKAPSRPGQPLGVLHVLTAAYQIGGHTRLVWRWITADRERSHSVLLTSQREFRPERHQPPPGELVSAVADGGNQVIELDDSADGVLERAQALRDIAAGFDVVVLHIHPWDAVPVIALHGRHRPRVIFMNHADHVFWVGVGVSDTVAHIRDESAVVSQRVRGVTPARSYVLPVPLVARSIPFSREEAKRRLGIPEDAVVLFSAGSPHKYEATAGPHFTELVLPALEMHPNAILVVVGPAEGSPWREANERTAGRVRVFGFRDDVDTFVAAADVFLNSVPLGSLTTALEAALQGVPVVSYEMPGTTFIRSSDPAFSDPSTRQTTRKEYVAEIGRMIVDEERRRTIGAATRDNVLRWHCGAGWHELLESLYSHVRRVGQATEPLDVDDERQLDEVDYSVHRFHAMTRFWEHFAEAHVLAHARFMPVDRRLVLAARTRRLAKLIPPLDIRTRAHLERPRRYVAADPIYPADWPEFFRGLIGAARTQTGDLARTVLPRAPSKTADEGCNSLT